MPQFGACAWRVWSSESQSSCLIQVAIPTAEDCEEVTHEDLQLDGDQGRSSSQGMQKKKLLFPYHNSCSEGVVHVYMFVGNYLIGIGIPSVIVRGVAISITQCMPMSCCIEITNTIATFSYLICSNMIKGIKEQQLSNTSAKHI